MKSFFGHIVGAVVGVAATILSGGNLWLGFQAYSMSSSVINAAMSGNWGGLAGGIAGGLIGGAIGVGAASGIYNILGDSAFSFAGGFLGGAVEFGFSGFGAGFGYSLGSGASFGDAAQSGLIAGGISAAIGGLVQGSYNAGWQNIAHGSDRNAIGEAAGVKRQMSLEIVKTPLPKLAKLVVQNDSAASHWGLRISDNYNEYNGTWDFDFKHTPWSNFRGVGLGERVTGYAGLANGKTWTGSTRINHPNPLEYITDVYGNIQKNLGKHYYELGSYTCQTWVNNRLALKNDNFTQ